MFINRVIHVYKSIDTEITSSQQYTEKKLRTNILFNKAQAQVKIKILFFCLHDGLRSGAYRTLF